MDVKLACPKCKAPLEVTLAQLSAGSSATCTHCGELLRFQGADTAKVQRALDELQGRPGGANVKVNVRVNVKPKRPWWKFRGA
jgi:hypothetical protein